MRKTKEIGIRKVLGATVSNIVGLLSLDFLKLVVLALVLASPVAWYFMSNWLKVFPYNPGLSFLPFVVSALLIVTTASATAIFYSAKAALSNPARNLRSE